MEGILNFTNNPNLTFQSLENEQYRVYEFPDDSMVFIDEPIALHVSASGGHRVLDASGFSHYIPKGWNQIVWEVKEGKPAFDF